MNARIEVLVIDLDDSEAASRELVHYADTINMLLAVSEQHADFAESLTNSI